MSEDRTISIDLDLKGLNCPLPILRTKLALTKLQPGEYLRAVTTDPMSVLDYRVFCERTQHELIVSEDRGDEFEFVIRRAANPREDEPHA